MSFSSFSHEKSRGDFAFVLVFVLLLSVCRSLALRFLSSLSVCVCLSASSSPLSGLRSLRLYSPCPCAPCFFLIFASSRSSTSLQVLNELVGDKSLERFRVEYEKLHTALKKSHENEKKLIRKCKELNAELVVNAAKVQSALRMSRSDQNNITLLKKVSSS